MVEPAVDEVLHFQSYTHALRHPVIIGRVAGWRLPWALSVTQLGAVAATAILLLATRPVWAHLGGVGNLALFSLIVGGAAWAVRHWRIEGRSPITAAVGILSVALRPRRRSTRNGRRVRAPRPVGGSAPVTVSSLGDSQVSV